MQSALVQLVCIDPCHLVVVPTKVNKTRGNMALAGWLEQPQVWLMLV